ncbi:MAG: acyltransferase family protein [Alphaproteobacteria bacterium]|jgi:glucans biosynthesis protein C|nr:acyltransferase family protein [Alphaproteobacteria bacterium]MBU2042255.1 acyltransferase family protein [Alphaproteobacteria bacterium]MBU2126054.1 acyltransferase family protein [Alphaproteobacteria bacterium]MBU2209280.1 acyltransferase family protein [Alphaproteobacteria bacterium]MBU2291941.1 acyltransferase family protein [Alphaproteobacteria bacterium]
MEFPPVSSLPLAPAPDRRHDLDWIRVGAFLLLILYHVGMFYVPWDWHVKSSHEVPALEPIMQLTNPWRLTLLFLVSGAATRFLADSLARDNRLGAARLAGSRALRLLPPLLFAMFVIVPPQSYYEIVEAVGRLAPQPDAYHNTFTADFWVRYATASGNWCDADGCLITPTWNHMWFVAYLLVYSLILAGLLALSFGRLRVLGGPLERGLQGWGLLVWPIIFLALIRWSLAYRFEITHDLVNDWYNHALSFSAFLFGFLTARSEVLRESFIRLRWPALILGLIAWAAWAGYAWEFRADDAMPAVALRRAMRFVYAADQWAFIAAILGFGARYLNRGGPVLRYLTIGVFPFYIIHQTTIVVVGHHLAQLGLPLAIEAGVLIAATFAACFLTYEVARRLGWAGLLLGVRPQAANRPPRAA